MRVLPACTSTTGVLCPWAQKWMSDPLEPEVQDSREPPSGPCELNPGPLEKHSVLFRTETSLQPPPIFLRHSLSLNHFNYPGWLASPLGLHVSVLLCGVTGACSQACCLVPFGPGIRTQIFCSCIKHLTTKPPPSPNFSKNTFYNRWIEKLILI